MRGLLVAFSTIFAVTAVGWLIGRYQILGSRADTVLARLVFFVATPALLFHTLANSSLGEIFTPALAAFVFSTVVLAAVALLVARLVWRMPMSESVVAALSASYVNAANLGIPVAAYALGDVSFVAPVLLFQVLVAAPVALAALETDGPTPALRGLALLPVRNPIMLASAAGLVLAITGWQLPDEVWQPFVLVGSAAVPTALLALGVSLSAERVTRDGDASRPIVLTLVGMKILVQPAVAYLFARFALDLTGKPLLAAVITSGLPAAQNVFVFATRYQRGTTLARDSVVISTLLAVISLTAFAYLLS